MRISQRDKVLLVVLAVALALAAYYYFGLVPQEAKIDNLEADLAIKEASKSEIELKLASEPNLDKRIESLEADITAMSQNYFSELTQEEVLMLVSSFGEGLSIDFSDLTFADNLVQDSKMIQTSANLSFSGDYQALMEYLRNTRMFDKKIVIREVAVQNQLTEGLSGRMQLEFNAIPGIEAYTVPYKRLVTAQFNGRDLTAGPFAPYDNFVVLQPTEPTMDGGEVIGGYPELEDFPDVENPGTEPGGVTYRPKTAIYGFEDGAHFFVGNNPDITGYVTRNKSKIAGSYSGEIGFDFVMGRGISEANLVFDTNPVMINRQAEYLGLWIYAYETSNHAISAVIIDSKGREFKVALADSVDWTLWKEVEVMMPVDITYPCMIQRLVIEGNGYDQKLKGRYLFDQLQVSYPAQ